MHRNLLTDSPYVAVRLAQRQFVPCNVVSGSLFGRGSLTRHIRLAITELFHKVVFSLAANVSHALAAREFLSPNSSKQCLFYPFLWQRRCCWSFLYR